MAANWNWEDDKQLEQLLIGMRDGNHRIEMEMAKIKGFGLPFQYSSLDLNLWL